MSENYSLFFDLESWKRSFRRAIRVTGYSGAIYILAFIVVWMPMILLGAPEEVQQFAGAVVTLIFFFGVILSMMKVMDEESAKPIKPISNNAIKLK